MELITKIVAAVNDVLWNKQLLLLFLLLGTGIFYSIGGGHGKERPAPSPLGTVTGSESARKTLRPGGRKALPLCPFA